MAVHILWAKASCIATPEFSRMGMYHVLGKMPEITWPSFLPRGQGCLIFLQGEAPQVTWGQA